MRRRDFIKGLVGSTALWPLGAHAQQQSATPVVGFLHSGIEEQSTPILAGFKKGLKESGFEEGRNISIQYRFAKGLYDRLLGLVNLRGGRSCFAPNPDLLPILSWLGRYQRVLCY